MNLLFNLLKNAYQNQRAVPAINFDSLEVAKGISQASLEMQYPVILMMTESAAKNMGIKTAVAIAKSLKENNPYLFIHWDHGFNLAFEAIDFGIDSVMYDGSKLDWQKNVANSQKFVELAKQKNVWTECEIGKIGGKEDLVESDDDEYTSIEQAVEFYQLVKPDMLAIAAGTIHGFAKKKIAIQFDTLTAVSKKIEPGFLVLHGCTGVDEQDLKKAINCGVAKLNFGTVLKKVTLDTLRQYLNSEQSYQVIDPKPMQKKLVEAIKQEVIKIIQLCQNY